MARPASTIAELPPRPDDRPLIWVHTAPQTDMDAVAAYATRLEQDDVDATLLVTGDARRTPPPLLRADDPRDTAAGARAFLDHWKPDLVLWMQGGFLGHVIAEADLRGIRRLLVDADSRDLALSRNGWIGRMRWNIPKGFAHALALDEDAAARLRRLGLDAAQVEVTGRLSEAAAPLPGADTLRLEISKTLGGRAIWFVPGATLPEIPALAEAHQIALRRSHRLLLVVMPRIEGRGASIAEVFARLGLTVARRSEGDQPVEGVQVLVAETEGELGTWYRLAHLCFMGGTLTEGNGRSPFEAAVLGAAVIHGPAIRPWESAYWRLTEAGASRNVRDSAALGREVATLLAPDRAAEMAHAGWIAISAGAAVTDRLIELTVAAFDAAGL